MTTTTEVPQIPVPDKVSADLLNRVNKAARDLRASLTHLSRIAGECTADLTDAKVPLAARSDGNLFRFAVATVDAETRLQQAVDLTITAGVPNRVIRQAIADRVWFVAR